VIGALTATAGGAGMLLGPLLLSAGLEGRRYLGTVAAAAVVMHSTRIIGYTAGGLVDAAMLRQSAVLAVAVVVGNLCGDAIRGLLSGRTQRVIELGAPVVSVALAIGAMF
jgi:hypothetical protein